MTTHHRPKVGMTLVEVLVSITIGGTLMAVLSAVMAQVVAAHSASSGNLEDVAAILRLGEQFRRDVHAATTSSILDSSPVGRISLKLADGSQVDYEASVEGVTRTVATIGQSPRREVFRLEGLLITQCQIDSSKPLVVSLTNGRLIDPADPTRAGRTFSITAAAGRNQRLEEAP